MPKSTTGGASNAREAQVEELDETVEAAPEPQDPAVEAVAVGIELGVADVAAVATDLSFAQLRAEAKSRGLPAGGTATELAARLAEHDETSQSAEDDTEDDDSE